MIGVGVGVGFGGGGGGGAALTANSGVFSTTAAQTDLIATLSDPFGTGSTFSVVGSQTDQLVLSGNTIRVGAVAGVDGQTYSLKVRATSANGKREVAETLNFTAHAKLTISGFPPDAVVGQPYSFTFTVTGYGRGPFISTMPEGLGVLQTHGFSYDGATHTLSAVEVLP